MIDLNNKKFIIDGEQFAVIENVNYEGKNYVYITNLDNPLDAMYVEVINDGELKLSSIDPELFKEKIFPLFEAKFVNY